jgi:CRP-like cAMP-binding protein
MRFRIHRQWQDGKVEALARSREFGWMEYRELELIAPHMAETTTPADVTLITEGQLNHSFFLVISGVLEATHAGQFRRFVRAGESCGATALSPGESATETIRTVTAARLLVADNPQIRASFQRLFRGTESAPHVPNRRLVHSPA